MTLTDLFDSENAPQLHVSGCLHQIWSFCSSWYWV